MTSKFIIMDETLRDGEQQALINFNEKQKIILATQISKIGVDFIDIMPISNESDKKIVKKLKTTKIILATPLTKEAINLSLDLNKDLILFQAVSDDLLKWRLHLSKQAARLENIKQIKDALRRLKANTKGIKVYVAGEDCSRADDKYLIKFIKSIEGLCDGFIYCDSVGILTPKKTKKIIKTIASQTNLDIGMHAHNDFNLADANTISAVLSGATIISGTFTGIGERAGNANLGNVLFELKNRGINLPQINYSKIKNVEKIVRKYAKRGPAKPLSKQAFYVETGIHVHALLKSQTGYSPIDPKKLRFKHEVFFSKKSGISNFKWYLGNTHSDKDYARFRDIIKQKSIKQNKSYTYSEVKKICHIK